MPEDKYPRRAAVTCIGASLVAAVIAIALGHDGALLALAVSLASILGGVVGYSIKGGKLNGKTENMSVLQRKTQK